MDDGTQLRGLVARLAPGSGDVIPMSAKGAEMTLDIGVAALVHATAASAAERTAASARLADVIAAFVAQAAAVRALTEPVLGERAMAHRMVLRDLAVRVREIDPAVGVSRAQALELIADAQERVRPAIEAIMMEIHRVEIEAIDARVTEMARRTALTDGMIAEMERIGRMIRSISINASVEAARAGGESGRAFQVIAQEVRSLATQSSQRLARLRLELSTEAGVSASGGAASGAGGSRPAPAPPPLASAGSRPG